jgi:hypothetical protein
MDQKTEKFNNLAALGQKFAGKEWVEILTIQEGRDDNGRETPIAKIGAGKIILFPYEYHKDLKVGEIWECRIIEDNQRYAKAVPIKKVSIAQWDINSFSPLPPILARVLLDALYPRKKEAEEKLGPAETRYLELCNEIDKTNLKLKGMKEEMEELGPVIDKLKREAVLYGKAIQQYEVQLKAEEEESNVH